MSDTICQSACFVAILVVLHQSGDEMELTTMAVVFFLAGLLISAWLAWRRWDSWAFRLSPLMFGFAFGLAHSRLILRNSFVLAAAHGLLGSAVGLILLLGVWAETRTGLRTEK